LEEKEVLTEIGEGEVEEDLDREVELECERLGELFPLRYPS